MTAPLAGQVALVAGATRGAGRAIALELALAGATVYATGRSSRTAAPAPVVSPGAPAAPFDLARRPETIEETAELIGAAGGTAIAMRVDHTDQAAVAALIGRIDADHGRLDILVNDIWGGDALTEWGTATAELDLPRGFTLLERAVHTHVITSRHALPLILRGDDGLIVEVTDGAGFFHRGTLFYDLAKTTVIRLAFALAEELRDRAVTALAITPGFLRSEAMLDHLGVTEATWRDAVAEDPHFAWSETPRYVARAIAAVAADPQRRQWSGRGTSSWALQQRYGFTDVDGATPDWGAHAREESFGAEQQASHARFVAMFDE